MSVKYILPNEKELHFFYICETSFVKSVIFFSASTCFVLFEVTFLFTKVAFSFLLAKSACANLTAKFSAVNWLNFCVVIYLLL